ncbi:hypothetical protein ACQEVF_56925 [Nonomuraea polychroma]|uniref:hypothetical protein n=1 Tax=Nonomuraea polychroma TaxID=46176 RepID=UPI003D8EB20D
MTLDTLDIAGRSYPVRPQEQRPRTTKKGMPDDFAAVRALNTAKPRRIDASLTVIETMLGSATADEVYERLHNDDDPLTLRQFLLAAVQLAYMEIIPEDWTLP